MDKPNNDKRNFSKKTGSDGRTNFSKPSRGGAARSESKPALPKRSQKPKKDESKPAFEKPGQKPARAPRKSEPKAKVAKNPDEIRLNKYIANSGMCSRRDADIYIQSGNVKVNGVPVTEMGYKVKPGDVVNFDGALITPDKKEYVLLNKPKNFTTAGEGELEMRNVLDLIKASGNNKLKPVGRMDKNTTGLLLFTNDSDMIRKFSQPNQKSPKIYQVSLDKNLKFEDLEKISGGVTLDEHRLYVDEISYIENQPKTEIGLKLRTANVKVVRSIFESFKYNVLKIDRVAFAGLTKKNLQRGDWRFLTEQEIINLRNA
ncbi:MAG: rRNA pseudouridine synthase [Flavobacterium sp.]|uniref:pseudouridine synthase n=1 Tax=Flavobacterium sp. TaxID=239 RepID=UPI0012107248|nr:pseudouridine synthase [Flavobacterium sp.]RZJ66749.1 MAG: rRNA pseudouridine synthase [Flavobacterium sp.]